MLRKEGKLYPVVSDEGFRVDRKGSPITQFVLIYSEDDRYLEYPLENLVAGSVDVIRASEIRGWLPPFDSEVIADSKKKQIAERIVEAMVFAGEGKVAVG